MNVTKNTKLLSDLFSSDNKNRLAYINLLNLSAKYNINQSIDLFEALYYISQLIIRLHVYIRCLLNGSISNWNKLESEQITAFLVYSIHFNATKIVSCKL